MYLPLMAKKDGRLLSINAERRRLKVQDRNDE
jgi:hypothetical protein